MRYPADQKQKTRQRILEAAAVVFRREGLQAGSVDKVMGEAGLTAGGFYAHFASKDALFAEMLVESLRQSRLASAAEKDEALSGPARIRALADYYLTPAHRHSIDRGCLMPPLLADLPRAGEPARRAFEEVLGEITATLAPHLRDESDQPSTDRALALLSVLIGGMTLARAVADDTVADRILAACRRLIEAALIEPAQPSNA